MPPGSCSRSSSGRKTRTRVGRRAASVVDAAILRRCRSPLERRAAPPDVAAGPLRHRRPRARARFDSSISSPAAGQRLWQVLPLGPTGYGDSPYQCFSAFAGNPLLISLDRADRGRSARRRSEAVAGATSSAFAAGDVDFPAVIAHRQALWPRVLDRFDAAGASRDARSLRALLPRATRAGWTTSRSSWRSRRRTATRRGPTWEPDIAAARSGGDARAGRPRCAREIRLHKLTQFLFFEQWQRVRDGLPRAIDRDHGRPADLRRARQRRRLGAPRAVPARRRRPADGRRRRAARLLQRDRAAVGQPALPLGRHSSAPATPGGSSASARCSTLVDRVRIDHFRGFEASWEVPARRHDGHQRRVGEGTGRRAVRRGASGAGAGRTCRSSPRTSA